MADYQGLEHDAPQLWARIRALAAQVGTTAPDHIVAGIDANFFVTEAEIEVEGKRLRGRSLYVSLPLLRVLDQQEADAVLAHELAHLQGGDTSSSVKLGPTLRRFDSYCEAMGSNLLTFMAFFSLSLYRAILEIALMRHSREREFLADTVAARCVGGKPLVNSLIKVAAYSSYRGKIEQELFDRASKNDGRLGISAFVADGLKDFSHSEEFSMLMETSSMPHPFDSHPKLGERMDNVATHIPTSEFGAVISAPLASSWASEIITADEMEARQWTAYEEQFALHHAQVLAYRYLPEGDAEIAHVQSYFPERVFTLDKDSCLTVDYDGIVAPDGNRVQWAAIKNVEYEDGMLGDVLTLSLFEKGLLGGKTQKVKLSSFKDQREEVKLVLGQYWHRHKVAHGVE